MKLLQKKGSALAAMFTAVVIACLGLAQRSDAAVTWLVSDDGTDLTIQTDGGTLNYNLNDWLTPGVANDPFWYSGSGAVLTNNTIYGGGTGARQVSETGAGVAGYELPIDGTFSSFVSGFAMASGDAFGVTTSNGAPGFIAARLSLPIGSALSGSITPITTFTLYGTTVSTVFGSNLDSGPVVIWEDRISGDTVQIGLAPAAVPEPSSTALLGLGGLALMLRRRR